MNFDPDKVAHELSVRGKSWADKDAQFKALDAATKSILGQIAGKMDGSEASKERAARASDEFQNHLQELAEARTLSLIAKISYEVYRTWIDMKRTELSYQKAEMNLR